MIDKGRTSGVRESGNSQALEAISKSLKMKKDYGGDEHLKYENYKNKMDVIQQRRLTQRQIKREQVLKKIKLSEV